VSLGCPGQKMPHPRCPVYPPHATCDDLTGLFWGCVCDSGLFFGGVREPSRAWGFVCGWRVCRLVAVCLCRSAAGLIVLGQACSFGLGPGLVGQKKTPDFSGACLWSV
jgi:hypothetical protein